MPVDVLQVVEDLGIGNLRTGRRSEDSGHSGALDTRSHYVVICHPLEWVSPCEFPPRIRAGVMLVGRGLPRVL